MTKKDIIGVNSDTGRLIHRNEVDKLTGTVSTGHTGGVTPTLREPIRKVDSDTWKDPEMTVADLQDQLATLEARRLAAYQVGNYTIAQQIEAGIARLQMTLKQRTDDDFTLI